MKVLLLTLISLHVVAVKADFVVAPNDRATQSGSNFVLDGFEAPATFQTVYGVRNFSQPVLITGLAFRMNEGSLGISEQVVIPALAIQLTTYSGTFASFNRFSYLANAGADNSTVFDSSVHWQTTDLAGGGPNPFDLAVSFTKPFAYDPSAGALLMNYTASGAFSSGITADAHAHGDSSIGWFSTPSGIGIANLVTRFEVQPIPEPATQSLIALALGGPLILNRYLRGLKGRVL